MSSQAHAFFWNKKKEKDAAKTTISDENKGYAGKLPDVEERFQYYAQEEVEPAFEYQEGFNDPDAIKPIPRNQPAFVNIIMKKDKTSDYVNDVNYLIAIIEKLQTVIEKNQNIQKFSAKSFFLKKNVEYFRDKYKNKSEESFFSYRKIMELNMHVQSVSQLRQEKEIYEPYVTTAGSGNVFSENNIGIQMEYLLEDIKKTLVVLKEVK